MIPKSGNRFSDRIIRQQKSRGQEYSQRSREAGRVIQIGDVPGPGKLTMVFRGEDGTTIEHEVFDYPGSGVALAMYNLDDSIRDFARASMNYALNRKYPLYLSTKNTILKQYDGRFMELFQQIFDQEFKAKFAEKKITYEHRLIDDMVAAARSSTSPTWCRHAASVALAWRSITGRMFSNSRIALSR